MATVTQKCRCGKYNTATAVICVRCGAVLGDRVLQELAADAGSGLWRLVGILAGLVVIAFVFMVGFFVGNGFYSGGGEWAWVVALAALFFSSKLFSGARIVGPALRWLFPYKSWR